MAGTAPPVPALLPGRSAADRLDSWKEIGAHLKRDVRTVQRWEKEHGLPVQRHINARQSSVFAHREELDAWWNSRRGELENQSPPAAGTLLVRLARSWVTWMATGVVIILVVVLAARTTRIPNAEPMRASSVVLGEGVYMDISPGGSKLALSPDGTQLAFVGRNRSGAQLYLRRLDQFDAKVLPGTDNAIAPFFSPDGRSIGFIAMNGIMRVSTAGGTPIQVCPVPELDGDAVWLEDDTIIFGRGPAAGLMRVSAQGGVPQPLTRVDMAHDEFMHLNPTVLPGGRTLLYSVWVNKQTGRQFRIDAQSLVSGERRTVLTEASLAGYLPGAGLIFFRGGRLMAARFDPDLLVVMGEPVSVLEDADDIAVTPNGLVAYTPGASTVSERALVWVDRHGSEESTGAPPRGYLSPAVSPDGAQVALAISDGSRSSIWTYDLGRRSLTPLNSDGVGSSPLWSPDGQRIIFSSPRQGKFALFSRPSDRTGPPEMLAECGGGGESFNRVGDLLFCTMVGRGAPNFGDIWVISGGGRGAPKPFLQAPYIQVGPRVSPDDRWLAYVSDETGRWEVFLTGLPGPRGKFQISTEGGGEPVWSRDGRTLFFRGGGKMMSASIDPAASQPATPPVGLFEDIYVPSHPGHPNYDVSHDGARLLMVKGEHPDRVPEIRLLQGWKTKVAAQLQAR